MDTTKLATIDKNKLAKLAQQLHTLLEILEERPHARFALFEAQSLVAILLKEAQYA